MTRALITGLKKIQGASNYFFLIFAIIEGLSQPFLKVCLKSPSRLQSHIFFEKLYKVKFEKLYKVKFEKLYKVKFEISKVYNYNL